MQPPPKKKLSNDSMQIPDDLQRTVLASCDHATLCRTRRVCTAWRTLFLAVIRQRVGNASTDHLTESNVLFVLSMTAGRACAVKPRDAAFECSAIDSLLKSAAVVHSLRVLGRRIDVAQTFTHEVLFGQSNPTLTPASQVTTHNDADRTPYRFKCEAMRLKLTTLLPTLNIVEAHAVVCASNDARVDCVDYGSAIVFHGCGTMGQLHSVTERLLGMGPSSSPTHQTLWVTIDPMIAMEYATCENNAKSILCMLMRRTASPVSLHRYHNNFTNARHHSLQSGADHDST